MNSIVFSILLALLEKRKITRSYISEKFEISKRSVSRYIEQMQMSGIPVISVPGIGGGYMIPDDYKIDKSFLTDEERARIISSLGATSNTYDDKVNKQIIEKLAAFNSKSGSAEIYGGHFVIDAGPWGNGNLYKKKIDTIEQAIVNKQTILIKYIDRNDAYSERHFDPYNIVLKHGVFYTYGYCHERKDFRLFKLSRISYMILTDKSFDVREGADIYEKLRGEFENYNEIHIVIEFSSLILSQIEEWLGMDAIYENGTTYMAEASVFGGNELVSKILSFGSSVKVISPPVLKEEVLVECKRILNNI